MTFSKIADIIVEVGDNIALAFALDIGKGRLIYIPCQRDFSRLRILNKTFTMLIDNLITYLTKRRGELPKWALPPMFREEEQLTNQKEGLVCKLGECSQELEIFHSAKQLLFEDEYGLEKVLFKFLQEQCDISLERDEKYKEDFWILNPSLESEAQKIAICEVKSYVKGFKKNGLFSLYNHRESNGLDESFPAVLFVNANLNAASWKQKDKKIDKQDYEEAANKHILIIRIEDLLFAWQALRENVIDRDKLISIFTNEVGWLDFRKDGTWHILA
ncbi:hypothetical protein ACFL6S_35735 [Candidatus Poribacteria bacterium]